MKRFTLFILFLVIGSIAVLPSYAQTKQLPEISVDLGSGVISGALGLPFDVPFRFKGTTTPSLRKISLTYHVSSSYPNYEKLQWKGNIYNESSSWSYVGEQPEWRLSVGPIHPNVPYDFIFTVTRIPDVKAPEKEKFKQEAYKMLEAFYDDPSGINEGTIAATNAALNVQLTALIPPGQKIIYPDGDPYLIDISDPPFSTLLNKLKDIQFKQMSMATNLMTVRDIFFLPTNNYSAFRARLANIINDPSLLTQASKAIIDSVIDAGNPKYKAIKMIDIGNLAKQPTHRIDEVFEGKLTLSNNVWGPTQKPDIDLMQLIYQFYSKLSDNLDMQGGGKAFTNADISMIQNGLLSFSKDIIATQIFNSQLAEIKNAVLAQFPDVLADKLLSATYIITDQSYIDAVSQSTPYVGLDMGFSYIPGYSQLFIYEGVNFYLVPVNKDAPLSSFNKRYWWLKRLSIHFGLTQSLIKVENKRYVPLIDGVGSVIVGAGLRFNRIMRINAGYMLFYEKDNNPLKANKHFTALPQFSLTFDFNVAKALGGFGKRLGISQ